MIRQANCRLLVIICIYEDPNFDVYIDSRFGDDGTRKGANGGHVDISRFGHPDYYGREYHRQQYDDRV